MRVGRAARARKFAGLALDPELDGGWMYRCSNCDLLFRHPILLPSNYEALYAPSAGGHWTKAALRPEQRRICDHVRAWMPQGGRVLDVGCAAGDLLDALGSGFEKFGIEPAEDSRARAQQLGVTLVGRNVDDLAACELEFDLVTAIDVIEHVPDPIAFLATLMRNLRPGGWILVSTGNSRSLAWRASGLSYYYSHFFEHITFISPSWCEWAARQGLPNYVLEPMFAHRQVDSPTGVRHFARIALFGAQMLASKLERAVLMRLPTVTRRLGPRFIVGEPGVFRDHLLVAFGAAITGASCIRPEPETPKK